MLRKWISRVLIKTLVTFWAMLSFSYPVYSWAEVELLVWQSSETSPKVILPLIDNEPFEKAINRYVDFIYQNEDLKILLENNLVTNHVFSASKLPVPANSYRPRLLFIANQFQDILAIGERIQRNIIRFTAAGADPFVVGISADIGLSKSEALQFRNKIAVAFNLLVALGGEDISEELSGRTRRSGSRTVFPRDISELALIKKFKEFGQGLFFGICRGHQIGAIADGHTVIDDLTESGIGQTHEHVNKLGGNHTDKQTWHHIYIENGSLLARFSGIKNDQSGIVLRVNSIHHQAVSAHDEAHSHVIAHHETSGVEALQMKNGRGVSVQYHPEFPAEISGDIEFSNLGFRLIRNIVAYSRLIRMWNVSSPAPSCSQFLI